MAKIKECLLIEDDVDDQEIFQMALADIPVRTKCTIAGSGREALTKLKTDDDYIPDVVFIDMNMPMMSGMECMHEIRQLPRLETTRIYMYSTVADIRAISNAGLNPKNFIIKPASLTDLIKVLSVIFEELTS